MAMLSYSCSGLNATGYQGQDFKNKPILVFEGKRTKDFSRVKPCLSIIVGVGGILSEGEDNGGKAASRATYCSSVEREGDLMVEMKAPQDSTRSLPAATK